MKKLSIMLAMILVVVMALAACSDSGSKDDASTDGDGVKTTEEGGGEEITIAMLPKFKGENYFDAVKKGAEEAIEELTAAGKKVTLIYDGPPQNEATNQKQADLLQGWIAQNVNVIMVSPNDPNAIAPTLKNAQAAGIKVLTFDADAAPDARDLFINQASTEAIAEGMLKAIVDKLGAKGYGKDKPANIGMVSSAKTDANQNAWIASIKDFLKTDAYSWLKIKNEETDIYYPGPDETEAQNQSGTLIGRMGEGDDKIQAAIGLTSMSTPALGAQYESAASKPDATKITITGLATPNALKDYIKKDANPLETGVLWNCMDLGYLSVMAGYQFASGEITADSATMTTERLGEREIKDKMILLGDALVFDKANVDQFDY